MIIVAVAVHVMAVARNLILLVFQNPSRCCAKSKNFRAGQFPQRQGGTNTLADVEPSRTSLKYLSYYFSNFIRLVYGATIG